MTLDEIIADLQSQIDWRGPGGQPQGHIVITRHEAIELLSIVKNLISVERAAWAAFNYHLTGYGKYSHDFDANSMLNLLNTLGRSLQEQQQ